MRSVRRFLTPPLLAVMLTLGTPTQVLSGPVRTSVSAPRAVTSDAAKPQDQPPAPESKAGEAKGPAEKPADGQPAPPAEKVPAPSEKPAEKAEQPGK